MIELLGLLAAVLVLTVVAVVAFVSSKGGRGTRLPPPKPGVDYRPGTGDDAEVPRDTPQRPVDVVDSPLLSGDVQEVDKGGPLPPQLETPAPTAGRLQRLREREPA